MKGTVKRWFKDRGYGFINCDDGSGDVFLHISDIKGGRLPRIGDTVSFQLTDDRGKPRAANVKVAGGGLSSLHWFTIIFFVTICGTLGLHFTGTYTVPIPILFYAIASLTVFFAYHADKSAARRKNRRISESSLHFMELIGGWPGSLLASRLFRHKTVKRSYRIVFWCIVALHIAFWYWMFKAGCGFSCDLDTFMDIILRTKK